MKYCSQCLQPDTRPNTVFLPTGICPACNYFNHLNDVDYPNRYEILKKIFLNYPKKSGQYFDCIIGVSGGKDSTRQALWIREKLGMKPLLVCCTYPPEQVTHRGVNNLSNLIELGFDVVISAPAPGTWKILMRESFLQFTNWAKSTEMALYSSVPRLAIQYGIQLILWGENPGLQLGDMKTLGATGYDGNNLRNMNTLANGSDWMLDIGLNLKDLIAYQYPKVEEFEASELQIIYLGWFLADWSNVNNAMYSIANGLEIRTDTVRNTGDLFGITALDEDWVTLNQMIKYYKYGFGRATDYVNEEIRLGRMSRKDGIELVNQYDNVCSEKYIKSFCDYIDISVAQFWEKVYNSINKNLFEIKPKGVIKKKFKVGIGLA